MRNHHHNKVWAIGRARPGGLNTGCTEIMSPWGDAVAERGFTRATS